MLRKMLGVFCAGLLLAGLTLPAAATDGETASAKLSEGITSALEQAKEQDQIDVVVHLTTPVLASTLQSITHNVGFKTRAAWQTAFQGFAASLTPAQVRKLSRNLFVRKIEMDAKVQMMLDGATRWTGVTQARSDWGVTGDRDNMPSHYGKSDVVVAIIDTGIDAAHIDLNGGKVIGWKDVVNGRYDAYDDNGHGTHVASIVAGSGQGNSSYKGVAPGAGLVGIKVLSGQGSGSVSGIITGIEWMITNKEQYGIRVANMSLGSMGCSDGTDALSAAVNRAVDSGIVMVVAAGNSGPGSCTIGSPAAAEKAITVGAAYDPAEKGWALAEFSSRGPTRDRRVKPDIVAPGRYITAAKANSGNGYVAYSGTSMATPFAAGVVALMLDANYSLTPDGVKSILYGESGTWDWGPPGKDVDWGYGILKGYDAVKAAGSLRGSFSYGILHQFTTGHLAKSGSSETLQFTVTRTGAPIALTFVTPGLNLFGYPDFDIYLYDPDGKLAGSSLGKRRQEQILVSPAKVGTYQVRIYSYWGKGDYWFDVSSP